MGDARMLADAADERSCSVLVPVLNEEEHIEHSVAAMQRQTFPGRLEFLFADGGSTDRTPEILERLSQADPRIQLLVNPHRSVPSGLNLALAHATGHWVARMDAHAEYPDDYLELGVRRLELGEVDWVSGPAIPRGVDRFSRAVAMALGSPLGRGASRKWASGRLLDGAEFDLDSGVFAGVWRRESLLAYGGWDERWPRNSDSELAGRFLEQGARLVCVPAMGASYVPRRTPRALLSQYHAYGIYRAKTATYRPLTMRRSHLLAPGLVVDAAAAIVAPPRLRRVAHAGLGLYGSMLAAAGWRSGREAPAAEAALVPIALLSMHIGHGSGFLRGSIRFGPPLSAIASAIGLDGLSERLSRPAEPTYNPSLRAREPD